MGAKVMKKELNYLASKRWEKVGRQELRSTLCQQEIDPWMRGCKSQFEDQSQHSMQMFIFLCFHLKIIAYPFVIIFCLV
jgi:hypothetical protein